MTVIGWSSLINNFIGGNKKYNFSDSVYSFPVYSSFRKWWLWRRCWISWTFWMRWIFGYPCIGLRWVLRLDQGLILMVSTYRIHVLKHWFGSTSPLRNITSYLSLAIKKWQWWNWTTASYTYNRHQLHNIIMLLSTEVTINQGAVEFFCGLCPVCDTLGSIVCTQQC